MFGRLAKVRVLDGFTAGTLPVERLVAENLPTVLPGLARDWPLVQAGLESPQAAMAQLRSSYNGRPVQYNWGDPATAGRPFYNDDFTALNCQVRRGTLDQVLDELASHLDDPAPPTYYVASLLVDYCLPGLRERNDLGLERHGVSAPPSIWIGNRVTASCHYDAPSNIACCAVGRRRFTVFPPEQVHNLYPGPLQPTPGGQAVSVVDFDAPDLERFPRFAAAMEAGQTVVLEPGDAIFIPSLWWHHVKGLDPFTVLVNYWWSSMPEWIPTPMHALNMALWSIRDRPGHEKRAWREMFEYYVFGPAGLAGAHLPEQGRGELGPFDETTARRMRAALLSRLNR